MAHQHHAESSSESHEAHVGLKTYFIIFALLMILLVVTVAAAFIPTLPYAMNTVIAMSIAVLKATLVVLYFMHVMHGSRLTQIFAASGFVWLAILFVFLLADYVTRDQLPASRGWIEQIERQAPAAAPAAVPPAPAAAAVPHE